MTCCDFILLAALEGPGPSIPESLLPDVPSASALLPLVVLVESGVVVSKIIDQGALRDGGDAGGGRGGSPKLLLSCGGIGDP